MINFLAAFWNHWIPFVRENAERNEMSIEPKFAAGALALALAAAACGGEFSPGRIDWRLPEECARIEGSRLTVEIPRTRHGATAIATATIPAGRFKGL